MIAEKPVTVAQWAKVLMEERGLTSTRHAENFTRGAVSYSVIHSMLSGRIPSELNIVKFAAAFGQNIPDALRRAGYDDFAKTWEFANTSSVASNLSEEEERLLSAFRAAKGEYRRAMMTLADGVF